MKRARTHPARPAEDDEARRAADRSAGGSRTPAENAERREPAASSASGFGRRSRGEAAAAARQLQLEAGVRCLEEAWEVAAAGCRQHPGEEEACMPGGKRKMLCTAERSR